MEQSNSNTTATTEIEGLKLALLEKERQLLLMENACLRESERQVELEDSVIAWQDKYDRLYESHKRVQKINQNLEDKLLKMVDRNTGERAQLTSDVATLSVRLAQANFNIAKLRREIERYKADINLAIQLLQCNPESFMPQKISSLPIDVQSKVSSYMKLETNSQSDSESSGVGIATSASYKVLPASESPPPAPCPFPPTAMVYSMRGLDAKKHTSNIATLTEENQNKQQQQQQCNNSSMDILNSNINNNNINNIQVKINNKNKNSNKSNNNNMNSTTTFATITDQISPLIMAKFLENELKNDETKHCETCQCPKSDLALLEDVSQYYTVATQTQLHLQQQSSNVNENLGGQLCMRCHSNLNSPSRTNSPFLMKVLKSSDSVISETKSSVSDLNDVDKLFTPPPKNDDLMVNPILGHHRLCDRTSGNKKSNLILNAGIHQSETHQPESKDVKANSAAEPILYPTTYLGTYEAEKYLLETNTLAGIKKECFKGNRENFQQRFLDGDGSALCLLNNNNNIENSKYNVTKECNGLYDGVSDEEKPLLHKDLGRQQCDATTERKITSIELSMNAIKSPTSTCSVNEAHNKRLAKSVITGSMNSLWSKGNNYETSKIFENFNRNLIRTIKSENPRYKGPRLCAMRIQSTENGQSNILLDNMESLETITPVIYKRRERLMDEELDDTKDVITSGSPAVTNQKDEPCFESPLHDTKLNENLRHMYIDDASKTWSNKLDQSNATEEKCNQKNIFQPLNKTEKAFPIDEVSSRPNKDVNVCIASDIAKSIPVADERTISSSKPSKQTSSSYEILRNDSSSKTSINSRSCTQSSSVSEITNLRESDILRRQQLNRVAEWIQNNTQQLEEQQKNFDKISSTAQNCDSSGTDQQSSFSTLDQLDSVSIEKLSTDSGYKTTPQAQTNGSYALSNLREDSNINCNQYADATTLSPTKNSTDFNNPSYLSDVAHRYAINIGKSSQTTLNITAQQNYPIAKINLSSSQTDWNCNTNVLQIEDTSVTILPEQPTCDILNYKYYPCERDKSRAIEAELHMTSTNVDIAQMEYNVKQFLLKQNEWSIRSNGNDYEDGDISATAHKAAVTAATAAVVASTIIAHPNRPKAIRRSKLFSNVGIGPGVGERVRTNTSNANTNTNCGTSIIREASNQICTPIVIQKTIPQRTETNL